MSGRKMPKRIPKCAKRLEPNGSGLLQYFGCGRQSEVESRAPSGIGRGPQTATMRLNNGTADRQAHPGALRFGRKECIEDLVRLLGRVVHYPNSRSLAGDAENLLF
jgi:hypothetical protein